MQPQSGSRLSAHVPDEARLADLVQSIRAGVTNAHADLRRIFEPGTRFLMRRRLGLGNVDSLVAPVLDAVCRKICEDISIDGKSLPGLVRRTIAQFVPPAAANIPKNAAESPAISIAAEILQSLSPVERDALRRCYVLNESPESILSSLKLTPDQFRAVRIRARTEFSMKTHETNVA